MEVLHMKSRDIVTTYANIIDPGFRLASLLNQLDVGMGLTY